MDPEETICNCMGVTAGAIKEAVDGGASTLKEVQDATGAGTICGDCFEKIEHLVDAYTKAR